MPPELLRKGRFDEIFFVDLPSTVERKDIFNVHLSKRNLGDAGFDLDKLSRISNGYSGAEIEEAVVSAMFNVFYDNNKMTTKDLVEAIENTVPLSKTMSEDMEKLRDWANGRARLATSEEYRVEPDSDTRKLEL